MNILIPKPHMVGTRPLAVTNRVMGRYRFVLRDRMGRALQDTGWKNNLILNDAFFVMGEYPLNNNFWYETCELGSNATAAAYTDTGCITPIANAKKGIPSRARTSPYPPVAPNYEYGGRLSWRFLEAEANGTIQEISLYSSDTVALPANVRDIAMTRAVVSPAIVKTSDQVLDVFYEIIHFPLITDESGTFLIDSEVYEYTARATQLASGGDFIPQIPAVQFNTSFNPLAYAAPCTLNPFTGGGPDGDFISNGDPASLTSTMTYDNNSVTNEIECLWDLNDGNNANGIGGFSNNYAHTKGYQYVVSKQSDGSSIDKDATKRLTLSFNMTTVRGAGS